MEEYLNLSIQKTLSGFFWKGIRNRLHHFFPLREILRLRCDVTICLSNGLHNYYNFLKHQEMRETL